MKTFEYKRVSSNFLMTFELDQYGKEGWELIQVLDNGSLSKRDYIFKREKNDSY